MDKDLEIKRRLVILLDELLEKDYWQDSLFLQAAEKEIRDLRAKIAADPQLAELLGEQSQVKQQVNFTPNDSLYAYIALYQADGSNFDKWSQVLSAIGSLSISRPIYRYEHDIKTCMRAIDKKQNHGYAAILLKAEDILSNLNNPPRDKNGYELLMVKEKAMRPENISSFVHVTGQYAFENGTLIRKGDVDFNVD